MSTTNGVPDGGGSSIDGSTLVQIFNLGPSGLPAPSSPDALDDEFSEVGALSGWTLNDAESNLVDASGAAATPEVEDVRGVCFRNSDTNKSSLPHIYKAAPSGDFTADLFVTGTSGQDPGVQGMVGVGASTNSPLIERMIGLYRTGSGTGSSGHAIYTAIGGGFPGEQAENEIDPGGVWVRVAWDDSAGFLHYLWSRDGLSFVRVRADGVIPVAPSRVGIYAWGNTGGGSPPYNIAHWCRSFRVTRSFLGTEDPVPSRLFE